jgi:hypothetical protein
MNKKRSGSTKLRGRRGTIERDSKSNAAAEEETKSKS